MKNRTRHKMCLSFVLTYFVRNVFHSDKKMYGDKLDIRTETYTDSVKVRYSGPISIKVGTITTFSWQS
jgi:hypothetical protein